ncbi:MAG: hypothetical protein CVT59_08580 [Actinobacteria bacterium HGW-Actinobacteria-1]|nr:MAG: hypothetical protein CVT59_08580 [Actinobacteria bacterium HGW-Actinobacteria-1]
MSDAAQSALETISPDGGMLVFDAASDEARSIQTSDVLVAGPSDAAPSGYLVRVLDVTEAGGQVTVETTAATLADVIIKGSLDVTGSVDPNSQPEDSQSLMLESATAVDSTHIDLGFGVKSDSLGSPTELVGGASDGVSTAGVITPQAEMGAGVTIPFDAKYTKTGTPVAGAEATASVSVSGRAVFSGNFALNASWGHLYYVYHWWGRQDITGLQNVTFATYLSELLELDVRVDLDASYATDIIETVERRIGKDLRFQIGSPWFWVGWVPVNITFYVQPIAELELAISGSAGVGLTQQSSVTFGVQYDYGYGWRPIRGSSSSFNLRGPTFNANASADLKIGAQLECMFYNAFGPYLGVTGDLTADADTTLAPWWHADVSVDGNYGGRVDIFGQSASFGGSVNFLKRRIAQAPGGFPTGGVVLWPSSVAAPAAAATVAPASVVPVTVDAETLHAADFSIDGLDVLAAEVVPGGVRLTTSPQTRGKSYVITALYDSFGTTDGIWSMYSTVDTPGYFQPEITRATATALDTVEVSIDAYSGLDPASVQPSDFSISGLTVLAADLQEDGSTVRLTTSKQRQRDPYEVSMASGAVSDATMPWDSSASSAAFLGDWVVAKVEAGAAQYAALDTDGDLWMWGANESGQLGDGTYIGHNTPQRIAAPGFPGLKWQDVDCSRNYTYAIDESGRLWSWGDNLYGELGRGVSSTVMTSSPVPAIVDAGPWRDVDGWWYHGVGVKADGTAWAWGLGLYGQLGNGSSAEIDSPIRIGTASDWVEVKAGKGQTIGLRSDGTVWGVGRNVEGQLGNLVPTYPATMTQIVAGTNWASVVPGNYQSVIVDDAGVAYSFGQNVYGQLGRDTGGVNSAIPTPTTSGPFTQVSANLYAYVAIGADGRLYVWGQGQGLDAAGAQVDAIIPRAVAEPNDWVQVEGGWGHRLLLTGDGVAWFFNGNPSVEPTEVWAQP